MMKPITVLLLAVLFSACAGGIRTPQITPATDDQSVAARVRAALLNDPVVHANEISVTAQSGVVVLRGQVHGVQEANAAIAVARRVNGVTDVRSELQTK
jgi:hyperosmotically inducible protein